jgi:hypothetical protein
VVLEERRLNTATMMRLTEVYYNADHEQLVRPIYIRPADIVRFTEIKPDDNDAIRTDVILRDGIIITVLGASSTIYYDWRMAMDELLKYASIYEVC